MTSALIVASRLSWRKRKVVFEQTYRYTPPVIGDRLVAVQALQRAFGVRVRRERKQAGLSQQRVADQLGVTAPTISALENGHRGPSIELLCRLAVVLRVPPGTLLPPLEEIDQLFSANEIVSKVIRELDEEEASQ